MLKTVGIVGGGIVGLATAYKLQEKYPGSKVLLFEKEAEFGLHQSGRNSGVLHCGLYYEPGSLKARLAVEGIRQMSKFCITNKIDHEICGKIVVATDAREIAFLDTLADRGHRNGLKNLKFLSAHDLKQREPFVNSKKSLLVPEEGIVDYKSVMQMLAQLIQERSGQVILNTGINGVVEKNGKIVLKSQNKEFEVDLLVNCTGLHTDRNYIKFTKNAVSPIRIVPFRGEYFKLKKEAEGLVNHLIYPVPDPEYPFLGVHFTRMITGVKEVGPNAVFALKREGYLNTDFSLRDTYESLTYKGFANFLLKNFSFAMSEFSSSVFKSVFLKKANKLIPDLRASDMEKGMAGVRAQAIDPGGNLIMDFRIVKTGSQVHVLNAPSPGATASLAIADHIIDNYITN